MVVGPVVVSTRDILEAAHQSGTDIESITRESLCGEPVSSLECRCQFILIIGERHGRTFPVVRDGGGKGSAFRSTSSKYKVRPGRSCHAT